ncbi:hypothetical protein B4Q04_20085 [Zobellia sp. OII3]|uniref:PulJ/GspJ family protein n=1 Tax=Zobellia sp. OII3 TaxID=2034520 RepID=UPI000B52BD6D|nr:hypothetical protein [Zobellia sp. OII3]OWW23501.1 hypothetical protein B4Q04_20085 [Zobellia sp. OII3]
MINRFQKISAFTLNEMIVVLLITTIVVGMAFSVLNLVQRQMAGIQYNYGNTTELNLLRQSLWIDFHRFDHIRYNEKNQVLVFENEMGVVRYEFEEGKIIKEKDTFNLKFEYNTFYFEDEEQSSGDIDAISLKTTMEYGGQRLFVFKKNSATIYMNR